MKRHSLLLSLFCLLLLFSVSLAETAETVPYDGTLKIADGTLLPMLSFTDGSDKNYTNEGSDILRFVVYVETDYDTDGDLKLDLDVCAGAAGRCRREIQGSQHFRSHPLYGRHHRALQYLFRRDVY